MHRPVRQIEVFDISLMAVMAAGSTTPDLLMVLTGEENEMVRAPTAEDFSTWRRLLPGLILELDRPAPKAAP